MERPFSENVVHSTYNTGTLNILMDYYIHREILVLSYKLFDVLPHVGGVEWNCGNSVTSSKINNKFDNCKKIEAFRGASHSINSVCALVWLIKDTPQYWSCWTGSYLGDVCVCVCVFMQRCALVCGRNWSGRNLGGGVGGNQNSIETFFKTTNGNWNPNRMKFYAKQYARWKSHVWGIFAVAPKNFGAKTTWDRKM